ncbi:hypothetical protein BH11ACT2_BH11ACT2_04270 [soil metagenome]
MRHPSALPEPFAHEPFSVSQALGAGIPNKRLWARDLEKPFWGVRSHSASTFRERAGALATRLPDNAVFSHETAARLWGMPIKKPFDDRLHVAVPPGHPMPRGAGVRGHRMAFDRHDVWRIGGLLVTSQGRTWCDLAATTSAEELVALGDYVLWRRRKQKLTRAELVAATFAFTGRRGRVAIAHCVPLLTERSDSRPESLFRYRAIAAGLPTPLPNFEIRNSANRLVAIPDLAWPKYKFCFDYEGEHHFTDANQWAKDLSRVPRIEDEGWKHVRAGKEDLGDSRFMLALLGRRLRSLGWDGRPTSP